MSDFYQYECMPKGSGVVLKTKILVLRHLEDKNKFLFINGLETKVLVLILTKKVLNATYCS